MRPSGSRSLIAGRSGRSGHLGRRRTYRHPDGDCEDAGAVALWHELGAAGHQWSDRRAMCLRVRGDRERRRRRGCGSGSCSPDRAKRAPRPRKGFAAHLERVEQIIEPEVPEDCEGLDRLLIGRGCVGTSGRHAGEVPGDRHPPPEICLQNHDGVFQAPAPAHIIESGIPTERLLAQIAVSKYAEGLPLYRQETIYARDGVELSRALMAQWMARLASSFGRWPIIYWSASAKLKGCLRARRRYQRLRRAGAKSGRHSYGHTPEMISRLAGQRRPWWRIASKTVAAASVSHGTWRASPAFCRLTDTPTMLGASTPALL